MKDHAIVYKLIDEDKLDKDGIAMLKIIHVKPKDEEFSLEEMQEQIGGYIEVLEWRTMDNELHVIIGDEDGKIKNRPINFGYLWNYGSEFRGTLMAIPERLWNK